MKGLSKVTTFIKPYSLGLVLVAVGLIILLAGGGLLLSWQTEQTALDSVKAQVAVLEEKKAALDRLVAAKIPLGTYEATINGVLVDEPSVPVVMDQVQQIASESNVVVSALQFAGSGTSGTRLQVSVGGAYTNVLAFLNRLETAGRLLTVSSLRVSAGVAGGSNSDVTATLELGNHSFSGQVSPQVDITKLITPEYTHLFQVLAGYKIYQARSGSGVVGKPNPFEK